MAKKYTEIDRLRFLNFIEALKEQNFRLEYDCCGIYEPPLCSYNDFSEGKKWPESIVGYKQGKKYFISNKFINDN